MNIDTLGNFVWRMNKINNETLRGTAILEVTNLELDLRAVPELGSALPVMSGGLMGLLRWRRKCIQFLARLDDYMARNSRSVGTPVTFLG